MKIVKKILVFILLIPVHFYRYIISPLKPASCRHIPTCSQYALDALKMHGPFQGLKLATKRVFRCHPWGTHGYDPVPKIVVRKYKRDKLK